MVYIYIIMLYKYRIFCDTDNKWEYIWDTVAPTECPINNLHTVNLNSVNVLNHVKNYITITNTNSPFMIRGYNFYNCDTQNGSLILLLRSATIIKNRVIFVRQINPSYGLIIMPFGTEKIDGEDFIVLTDDKTTLKLISNGTNWISLPIELSQGEDIAIEGSIENNTFVKGDIIVFDDVGYNASTGTTGQFVKFDTASSTGLTFTNVTVASNANIAANAGIDVTKLGDGTITNTHLKRLENVSSDIQTQLNNTATLTGTNTLTNKTIDSTTNTVRADKLKNVVITNTIPLVGQVLTATSNTDALWQTLIVNCISVNMTSDVHNTVISVLSGYKFIPTYIYSIITTADTGNITLDITNNGAETYLLQANINTTTLYENKSYLLTNTSNCTELSINITNSTTNNAIIKIIIQGLMIQI